MRGGEILIWTLLPPVDSGGHYQLRGLLWLLTLCRGTTNIADPSSKPRRLSIMKINPITVAALASIASASPTLLQERQGAAVS